jgi:hypothetical protein
MISGFDADQFLWLGESADQRFEFSRGAELVARSADEKFGLGAAAQKFEIVDAVFNRDGREAEGNESADSVVGMGGSYADGCSERKAGEEEGKREFAFQPIEGGTHIFDFSDATGVLTFTRAGAAEVEAEHGETEAIKRFHGVEDDFVVERSPKERVRMADEGGKRGMGRSGIEEGFQASGGAIDEQGTDAGGFGEHGNRVQHQAGTAFIESARQGGVPCGTRAFRLRLSDTYVPGFPIPPFVGGTMGRHLGRIKVRKSSRSSPPRYWADHINQGDSIKAVHRSLGADTLFVHGLVCAHPPADRYRIHYSK